MPQLLTIGPRTPETAPSMEQAFEKRPLLKEVLQKNGASSLLSYAKKNLGALAVPDTGRKQELIGCVRTLMTKRLGAEQADGLCGQLERFYCASSADHHGTLNAGLALSSNALLAAGLQDSIPDPYVFVLSCASVSLNNDDYPRGLLFHANGKTQKLSLLPSNAHSSLVYGFRPFTEQEVTKIETALRGLERLGDVTVEDADRIQSLITDIYKRQDVLSASDLCAQFSMVNFHLWQRMFEGKAGKLVYLELEELAKELLCAHHLGKATAFSSLLFKNDAALRQLIAAMAPFVRQGVMGTHLFWGISEKHQRVALTLKDGWLVTAEGTTYCAWNPDAIANGLLKRTLMPNLFVCYSLISLYYGLKCLGGFNQIHFLDALRRTYKTTNIDPLAIDPSPPLYQYGWDLFFLDGEPAYATDLLLYGDDKLWNRTKDMLGQTTLQAAFDGSASIIVETLAAAGT